MIPTIPGDVDRILEDGLREQDVKELAAQGHEPQEALESAVAMSGCLSFTIYIDGVQAAIFGIAPQLDTVGLGAPWLLGSDRLLTVPRELVKEGRIWVDWFTRIFPNLVNYVDERNTVSIRWLKAMGFDFDGAGFLAEDQETTFRRFSRCASPFQ